MNYLFSRRKYIYPLLISPIVLRFTGNANSFSQVHRNGRYERVNNKSSISPSPTAHRQDSVRSMVGMGWTGERVLAKVCFRRVDRWVLLLPPPPSLFVVNVDVAVVLFSPVKNEAAALNTAKYPSGLVPLSRSMSYIRSIRLEGRRSVQNTATALASLVLY